MNTTHPVFLTIAAAAIPLVFFPTGAGAADIIWITESTDAANPPSPDDIGWTDLLTDNGHTVTRRDIRDLDVNPGAVADLNAADLVIVSRDTNSGNYNNGGAGGVEATAWNGLTSPLILMSSYLARSSRWVWFNNTGTPGHSGNMDVLDPGHAIFAGITLDRNDEFAAIESGSVNLTASNVLNGGNATVLASVPNGGNIWIALFDAGVEFYAGSGQTPAATRMWFSGGITNNDPKGGENFNADGETAFLNAVLFLTGSPIGDSGILKFQVRRDEAGMLELSWDSVTGELYNVHSETDLSAVTEDDGPEAWPIYDGHENIVATPSRNVLTIPYPADPGRLFAIEAFPAPPVSIFSDDFETGPGDWTLGSDGAAGTVWELGVPTNGPSVANSPASCFGTNLTSNYAIDADVWLRSPAIDLTTAGEATLNYFQYRDIEEGFDFGIISVLDAADDSLIAEIPGTDSGFFAWELVSKRLPAEALGKIIKIEFRLTSDEIEVLPGWFIDDFEITVP